MRGSSSSSAMSVGAEQVVQAMAELKVLQRIEISPSPPLPSQPPHPLTFLDTIWLHGSQVERLFFYDFPHSTSHFLDNQLHPFIASLSRTLRHFYPLAGTIRPSPTSEDQPEIIYTEGDSVTVTIAVFTDEDFSEISAHHPRDFNKLRQLVPKSTSDGQSSLLSVQVTIFPNQGLCIGFAVNHAVCDGSGSMQFIRSWAAASRSTEGTADTASPFLDRSIIVDPRGLRQIFDKKIRMFYETYKEHFKTKSSSRSLVLGTFTLGKDQIVKLKRQVQKRAVEEGTPSLHISTFVVTCAYVWRSLVKARGYDDDRKQSFGCAVNWRARMRPPVPSNYFGNCLGSSMAEALTAGRIAMKDGFEVAAMAIGKSIDELQGKDVGTLLEETIDVYGELANNNPLSVSGSPKLGVYDTDFGWGRPVKVEVTSIVESGAMSLAESRGEEGGMEIGLVLTPEEMKKFGNIFAGDLLDIFI